MRAFELSRVDMREEQFEIRRARLGTLTIYEISESELEIIERGSPDSLFLTFAIFLLSTALSFSVTLLTTTISSNRTFNVFVIVTAVGYLGGIILLGMWSRSRKSIKNITVTIRSRLLPEGERVQQ